MSIALANTDEVTLRKFLVYSAFLHGALALAIGVAAYVQYRGDQWNSVGGNQGNLQFGGGANTDGNAGGGGAGGRE